MGADSLHADAARIEIMQQCREEGGGAALPLGSPFGGAGSGGSFASPGGGRGDAGGEAEEEASPSERGRLFAREAAARPVQPDERVAQPRDEAFAMLVGALPCTSSEVRE